MITHCKRCGQEDFIYAKGFCGSCYGTLMRNPNAKLNKPFKINRIKVEVKA